VPFKACDMPEADNFTIHIFAALAEREAKLISERTKAALEAKKARGEKVNRISNLTHDSK
jgi:DNA invertase Pin-like site-specific DNA recombinase